MFRNLFITTVMLGIILFANVAFAADETVTYATSTDGINWSQATVIVDSESWTKAYDSGTPMWIAGSEITSAAETAMKADMVAEAGVTPREVCKCFFTGTIKLAGYCPCGGWCEVNQKEENCSNVIA